MARSLTWSIGVVLASLLMSGTVLVEGSGAGDLRVGFYQDTCPQAEFIVKAVVAKNYFRRQFIAPGLLRTVFHDCFVRGCDASVLLDEAGGVLPEKNGTGVILRGLDVIDEAKAELEKVCPGVVSCADIITFAARDSVHISGGPFWKVESGRRDGRVSLANEAGPPNLPVAFFNLTQLNQIFAGKGFSQEEMIILSGGHTIGGAHCNTFFNRLGSAVNSTADPTLNSALRTSLRSSCPTPNNVTLVNLDVDTPKKFDTSYFTKLIQGNGVLTSDQTLISTADAHRSVTELAQDQSVFFAKFVAAMIKLSRVEVLTGDQGEIRTDCRRVNAQK